MVDGESANMVECWDTSLNETYLSLEVSGGSNMGNGGGMLQRVSP